MPKPTAAQRRIIEAADPATGRLTGPETQLTALARQRLAFRHPRPPHAYFLTPAGHRVRETPPTAPPQTAPAEPTPGVFTARTGTERPPAGEDPAQRSREVRAAWQGLLEIRRMTNPGAARDRPCPWERTHQAQAVAIALEAAGRTPASPGAAGYRVTATAQLDAVAVHEPTPEGVRACGAVLERAGWQISEHGDTRSGQRYVLASPKRL
ncbi:hypothetical protein [Streptomyces sp. G45]|uniref:hypothetical protein n=1 Tax=Streptomyces sp. G45 TaxID=3406627 RepID=UPI003C1D13C5